MDRRDFNDLYKQQGKLRESLKGMSLIFLSQGNPTVGLL